MDRVEDKCDFVFVCDKLVIYLHVKCAEKAIVFPFILPVCSRQFYDTPSQQFFPLKKPTFTDPADWQLVSEVHGGS